MSDCAGLEFPMKRFFFSAILASLFLLQGHAAEAARPWPMLPDPIKFLGGGDPVPPEWAGVWTVTDTVYQCPGIILNFATSSDTVCTGDVFYADTTTTYNCTGTATSTTVNITCTGSSNVFPDCDAQFTISVVGTRTADSYFTVTTIATTFVGTGAGCNLFPAQCTQINSHGIRTGPAPPGYCTTPAERTTWGQVKSRYH